MITIGSDEIVQRYVKALHSLTLEQKKETKIKEDLTSIRLLIENNKELKNKIKINFTADKNIISGFIVKLGSNMLDFSLKSKLDKIINSLK